MPIPPQEQGKYPPGDARRPNKPKSIATLLREIGSQPAIPSVIRELRQLGAQVPDDCTARQAMLIRAYVDAERGNRYARDFIADREEGKPTPVLPTDPDAGQPRPVGFKFHPAEPPADA